MMNSGSNSNSIPMELLYSNIHRDPIAEFNSNPNLHHVDPNFSMVNSDIFSPENNYKPPSGLKPSYGNLGISSSNRRNTDTRYSGSYSYTLHNLNDIPQPAFEKNCSSPSFASHMATPKKSSQPNYCLTRNYTTPLSNISLSYNNTPFSTISNSFVSPTKQLGSPYGNIPNNMDFLSMQQRSQPRPDIFFESPRPIFNNQNTSPINKINNSSPFGSSQNNNFNFSSFNAGLQESNTDFLISTDRSANSIAHQKPGDYTLNSNGTLVNHATDPNIFPGTSSNNIGFTNDNPFDRSFAYPSCFRSGAPQYSSSQRKRYLCPVCNKLFARPSTLSTHMHSHTGERPYHCTWEGCGKKFSVMSNLRRHQKIHLRHQNNTSSEKSSDSADNSVIKNSFSLNDINELSGNESGVYIKQDTKTITKENSLDPMVLNSAERNKELDISNTSEPNSLSTSRQPSNDIFSMNFFL